MNYELAKKLKDAGFPQKGKGVHIVGPGTASCSLDGSNKEGDWAYNPTLSELIEACGDRFISLNRFFDDHHQTSGWEAIGFGGKYPQIKREENIQGKGNTPEEAVANLWIKYHV